MALAAKSYQSTRWRQYKAKSIKGSSTSRNFFGNVVATPSQTHAIKGSQYTESEAHPFISSKKKGVSDLGGEFFTQKKYVICDTKSHSYRVVYPGQPLQVTTGDTCFYATPPWTVDFHSSPYSADNALDALGATAISIVAPNNPVASLTVALAELRSEGMPKLPAITSNWKDRTNIARNLGDEYLNVQFGWRPLMNDVTQFGDGVLHAHSLIKQYRRGIGKPIRRNYRFPTVRQVSETITPGVYPISTEGNSDWFSGTGSAPGTLIKRTETIRDQWFSGCFTYFFPSNILGSKKLADAAILARELGLEPSPETVWNVAPWSWAVDWFSNTGDVITNWTRFHEDGLVMRYGYMMEHSICKISYTLVGARSRGGNSFPVSPVTSVIETKVRRKANPYGFGFSWDGLSLFQGSILAALGISRA